MTMAGKCFGKINDNLGELVIPLSEGYFIDFSPWEFRLISRRFAPVIYQSSR